MLDGCAVGLVVLVGLCWSVVLGLWSWLVVLLLSLVCVCLLYWSYVSSMVYGLGFFCFGVAQSRTHRKFKKEPQ